MENINARRLADEMANALADGRIAGAGILDSLADAAFLCSRDPDDLRSTVAFCLGCALERFSCLHQNSGMPSSQGRRFASIIGPAFSAAADFIINGGTAAEAMDLIVKVARASGAYSTLT